MSLFPSKLSFRLCESNNKIAPFDQCPQGLTISKCFDPIRTSTYKGSHITFYMDKLPAELQSQIFSYLDITTLLLCKSSCVPYKLQLDYAIKKRERWALDKWKRARKIYTRLGPLLKDIDSCFMYLLGGTDDLRDDSFENFQTVKTLIQKRRDNLTTSFSFFKESNFYRENVDAHIPFCWRQAGPCHTRSIGIFDLIVDQCDVFDSVYAAGIGITSGTFTIAGDEFYRCTFMKRDSICISLPFLYPLIATRWHELRVKFTAKRVDSCSIKCGYLDGPDRSRIVRGDFCIPLTAEKSLHIRSSIPSIRNE